MKQKGFMLILLLGMVMLQGNVFGEGYSTRYYRQLVYNHVSPYLPIRGIYEVSAEAAQKVPHYVFKYDQANRLVEVVNHNPEKWKQHPLTHMAVYRMVLSYTQDTETRIYFDEKGKRIPNIRGVYQEVYHYDPSGFKKSLDFYDLDGNPMESDWDILRYSWESKNGYIVERRYNSYGMLAPVSTYFNFLITGIKLDEKGYTTGCYNLNENLEVVEKYLGIASYRDKYDSNGNHIEFAYYNSQNQLVRSPYGYMIGRKYYDEYGNVIREEFLNGDQKLIRSMDHHYDTNGYFLN